MKNKSGFAIMIILSLFFHYDNLKGKLKSNEIKNSTLLAKAGHSFNDKTGAVIPSIHPSTTYARGEDYNLISEYLYTRLNNQNYTEVEELCAQLDNGKDALVFSSGMAAIAAVLETLESGDHIVAPNVMYYAAQDWMRFISKKRGIDLTLFDAENEKSLSKAIRPGITKLVWIETPVNPTWDIIDIEAASKYTHLAGAFLCVDCTVAPPVTTKALDLGADIAFHSASKYYNGHSDVIAGILVTKDINERWDEIKYIRTHTGGIIGPFEAWLLLRGMRTLSIRFERASDNALKIAKHFENHPKIERILYPGLESHPGHNIAIKQMTNGFGGMLSLLIKGGSVEALSVVKHLQHFVPATSLGGVESLVEHRASVESETSAVSKNLLRFSVGIEDVNDLIDDIEHALAKI
jgi:cystathionine gamma-synthase